MYAGLVMSARNGWPWPTCSTVTRAPQGARDSRWAVSSFVASAASWPGGTRRLTCARALACTDGVAPTTGGQSMPMTVTAGRAQMRSATVPVPISSTPSSTLASCRNSASGYWIPSQSASPVSPSTVVVPSSARSEASSWIIAASASGAAPPNCPECRLPSRVSNRTRSMVIPRSVAVTVGSPTRKLPVSPMTIVSARSSSGCASAYRSRPPVPCSSEPSAITFTETGTPPSALRARSASRCMMNPPLQSAAPRPYQRPSRSVSSNGGESHADSSSGGCTS